MYISYVPVQREHYETTETYEEAVQNVQLVVMQTIRQERDKLLASSDWTQFNDSPLSAEIKAAWATYRQVLRDITGAVINWESEFVFDQSYFPVKP